MSSQTFKLFGNGALILLLVFSHANAQEPIRTWVDQSGLYSIDARVERVVGDDLDLVRPNGKRVRVSLNQLSPEDLAYVLGRNEIAEGAAPTEVVSNDLRDRVPVYSVIDPLPEFTLPSASTIAKEGSSLELAPVLQEVTRDELPNEIEPDAMLASANPNETSFDVEQLGSFDRISRPILVNSGENPIIGYSIESGSRSSRSATGNRVQMLDSKNNDLVTVYQSDAFVTLLDHHLQSNASLVLVTSKDPSVASTLAIAEGWQTGKLNLSHFRALSIPESVEVTSKAKRKNRSLHWARWVDREHVIAVVGQQLAVWNLISGECLHTIASVAQGANPALSAGCRYVAVPVVGGVTLYKTDNGLQLGHIRTDSNQVPHLSFSPRGDGLAIMNHNRLRVWELSSATLRGEVKVRSSLGSGPPVWVNSDLLLAPNGVLMSLYRGVPVWRYEITGSSIARVGNKVSIIRRRPKGEAIVTTLPHETAKQSFSLIDAHLGAEQATESTMDASRGKRAWVVAGRSDWTKNGWKDRDLRFAEERPRDLR